MGNTVSNNRLDFNKKQNKIFKLKKFSKNSRRSSKKKLDINVYIGGRRYLGNSKYSLPNDDEEIDRLHMQHFVTKFVWKKNFCSPVKNLLKHGNAKVLNVG